MLRTLSVPITQTLCQRMLSMLQHTQHMLAALNDAEHFKA